jgi:hypothetical protein
MAYVKPQVLVFQEFTIVPTEITEPLRAHISGPNALLHRYADSAEKALSALGVYDYEAENCYTWPGRVPGSIVDDTYTKLYIDDALLMYYEKPISATTATIAPIASKSNWIGEETGNLNFKANGGSYSRSDVFKDRDVKIGDVVYLRSVTGGEDCVETELWTSVTGFASETIDGVINNAQSDANNWETESASNSTPTSGNNYLQIAGVANCVKLVAVDAEDYSGVVDGAVSETYTIEVIKSSVSGCDAARLRVKSASKLDDVTELNPGTLGNQVSVGERGLKVTFDLSEDENCGDDAVAAGVATNTFVVGQKWQVSVTQAYTSVMAISNNADSAAEGTYTGDKNDTYIIECVKGGFLGENATDFPQISVRTAKGLDYSGPTDVTVSSALAGGFVTIGSHGVAVAFVATPVLPFTAMATTVPATVTAMAKGEKWYVSVVSSSAGSVNQLILKHDLPSAMRDATTLDMRLYIKSDIQVSKNRVGYAPLVNYETEATQICVKSDIVAYHPEWTLNGAELPLPVRGGKLYVEYREWLSALTDTVEGISTVGDLASIPGQLDPDNPLKWGVYKALSNSNGTVVKYTAVQDPTDLDSWVDVLARVKGRDDVYNFVPLTFDRAVQNLYAAHINDESNEVANNWKGGFVSVQARNSVMRVGDGAEIAGVAGNTIAEPVLATVSDNPAASGQQYTLLQVSTGSGYFITNGVEPGDIVRYQYAVDGFGDTTYSEYVVDSVLSEDSLVLYSGTDAAISQPQRVEIWHNLGRTELADDVATRSGSFGNRRICAVWPDQVGEGGTLQPGYYLAAALAGLASGVVPHQGLTNVEVAGFDDYSRSYRLLNETQLNRLAEAGVWLVTVDRDGTPYSRHAVTTDNLDLNRREEMIRRNVDSLSYLFLRRLRPYIGRTNATSDMVSKLTNDVNDILRFLKTSGYTQELGSQLIDGSIRVLRLHPLLKDRIEIVLDLVVPAPLNNIELHLVV